jgi:hypothetical protein
MLLPWIETMMQMNTSQMNTPTSRQYTTSAVVPFVALLQKDGVPFEIEMICKNTYLSRRRIKGQQRASRILLIESDQGTWTTLVGQ